MTTPCGSELRKKLVLEMDGWINSSKVMISNNEDFPGSFQDTGINVGPR